MILKYKRERERAYRDINILFYMCRFYMNFLCFVYKRDNLTHLNLPEGVKIYTRTYARIDSGKKI